LGVRFVSASFVARRNHFRDREARLPLSRAQHNILVQTGSHRMYVSAEDWISYAYLVPNAANLCHFYNRS